MPGRSSPADVQARAAAAQDARVRQLLAEAVAPLVERIERLERELRGKGQPR